MATPTVRVRVAFAAVPGGVYPYGLQVPADAPVVARFPQFFDLPPVVEAATAAPGEKRAAKPRATKKAKPADA